MPHRTPTHDDVAATLARWEADEARVRARLAPSGVARPEQIAHLSGQQIFAAMAAGELPSLPIGETMDFWPVEWEPGRFVFQGRPNTRFLNPMGTLHGGWIATLLDSCVACAVHSTLPAGRGPTTAELKISYVRALTPQVRLVRAEGRIINTGRQLGFAEGRLVGPDGTLYAHATTTCLVLAARHATGG